MHSSDIIRIHNASFYAYHGVGSDEQRLGGNYEVDVELRADLTEAKAGDSLDQTVDYAAVYALVQKIVTSKNYRLIEALADAVVKGILAAFGRVSSVVVRVRKLRPPVNGAVEYVEAVVTGER